MVADPEVSMLNIVLSAVCESTEAAWNEHCGDLEMVTVHRGSILDLKCDAVVSPANIAINPKSRGSYNRDRRGDASRARLYPTT